MRQLVLIIDFGSQYTQLIARRVRELGVYSEIKPFNYSAEKIKEAAPAAIILSGGPSSVWDKDSPGISADLFDLGIPILGICYGMQLIVSALGGSVEKSEKREFGPAEIIIEDSGDLFSRLKVSKTGVWMSHSDKVLTLPQDFEIIAKTNSCPIAAIRNKNKKIYATQFHPEVVHTPHGKEILKNFLFKIADCKKNWTPKSFVQRSIHELKERLQGSRVICGLSGGIDSTVTAALLKETIGKNLHCIFVDTGLLRLNESKDIVQSYKEMELNLKVVNAEKRFLEKLKGVTDPEKKRKIIGREFIKVFDAEAKKVKDAKYLAQGTLYPDIIESVSVKGPSATIKSHHNVGGLPKKMNLKLVEPLKELFKDEVRQAGRQLGVPDEILRRHPFPGPGLGIRIMGEITKQRLEILRQTDWIFIEELKASSIYDDIWQAFSVFVPVKTVGVMGDERTYENVLALRAVTSTDGMTASWARIPYDILERVSVKIINEVKGVNRVVYDVSTKPPSTIEWE
ncbi:MAG: glutamine-hydrolyzing GMP synthase [Candidatus Dadabacteria bacterium]|nr:glutamine-hydrolyzing GMP synthase [Candidatus Dadabacteria bacterium]NIS08200.1 glutamine-hydrolyzing GMP synthase [Candidatus Dadabacteria bacterium]NIV41446.1 glutamine-hydrolyzing GMP synthase [Candidatus Dadabacteria bacterium]NIY21690.1 glutamine-hydrolyzing GMP synthase [Candidatus Dadabacteria bacterium]